ncbi:MAG: YhgE/Pip domain-containing protein, partial [Microbacterium gubbeenense]
MTTLIERARTTRPVTWLTIGGVLLLPAVIGGVLVAALNTPTDRLENMSAAIVNLDDGVEIDGQLAPLGRQLAAGLVEGSDDVDSNIDWVVSNESDASDGVADGTYQAVVTIPEAFSEAAMSSADAIQGKGDPSVATIDVRTADDARIFDSAIMQQVSSIAADTMGATLSDATLENVFVSFDDMGSQLGEAADGATELADGASSAQNGAVQLGEGAGELGDGVRQLGDGIDQLATGADTAETGARELAGGTG